jgi:hypothetical protein
MKKSAFPRTSASSDHQSSRTIPLERGLRPALHALAAGFQLPTSAWPDEADAEWPVYESGVRLARGIVDAALDAPGAPGEAALTRAANAHVEQLMTLARERDDEPFSLDAYEPSKEDLALTSAALREQALEHHDAEVLVASRENGERLLFASPVTREQAHVWLSGSLYEKVEAWVREDPGTSMERDACAWWFSRWRGPRPIAGDEFASGVREQEFALVDRPMCVVGASPVEHLVAEGLLRKIGPRQQHMAAQLVRSEAGVWTVESRAEHRAVYVSPLDGQRYEVREHAGTRDTGYRAGFLALGRLIPFGDGTWLRSPGTFLMDHGPRTASMAHTLADGLQNKRGSMPLVGALELAAHKLAGVRGVPRDPLPAPSPDEAADYARDISILLREAGLARVVDPTSVRAARLAAQHPNTEILEYQVDVVLAEYISALSQQGLKSRAVRDVKRRRARQARKKGRRR